MEKIDKKIVIPGEKIGVIEEFIGKEGVYINGYEITSNNLGIAYMDYKEKIVKVEPIKKLDIIKKNSYALCRVKEIQDSLFIVDIFSINKKPLKHPRTGIILSYKNKGGKTILSIGDIIIAKILDTSYGAISLSVKEKNCGALLCFCEFCASPLKLNKILYCKNCKITQNRKILKKYYNNFKHILEWFRLE